MNKIIKSAANVLYPLALTYGFYIVIHGHLTPGGGFQGGAVIATAFALIFVAHDYDTIRKSFKKFMFNMSELTGLLLFVMLGLGGILMGNSFLFNWMANQGGLFGDTVAFGSNLGNLNTGGLIPILNVAIGFEVLGALALIIYYLLTYTNQAKEEK